MDAASLLQITLMDFAHCDKPPLPAMPGKWASGRVFDEHSGALLTRPAIGN